MITVLFTCKGCGLIDSEIEVRARRPDEDIRNWMKVVQDTVSKVHRRRSLWCDHATFDLKISMPKDDSKRIGDT